MQAPTVDQSQNTAPTATTQNVQAQRANAPTSAGISDARNNSGLSVNGNNVETERFRFEATESGVKIWDKQDGKWVNVWGDPHIWTSDGDRLGFHKDNVTILLDDGTKVTFVPTEQDAKGVAFIDRAIIQRGEHTVTIDGFADGTGRGSGVYMGQIAKNAWQIDPSTPDGTVLKMVNELDDLFLAATGEEMMTTSADPEKIIDGFGSMPRSSMRDVTEQLRSAGQELDERWVRLAAIREFMADFDPTSDTMPKVENEWLRLLIKEKGTVGLEWAGALLQEQTMQFQLLKDAMSQIYELLSNSMKSADRTASNIIRNIG